MKKEDKELEIWKPIPNIQHSLCEQKMDEQDKQGTTEKPEHEFNIGDWIVRNSDYGIPVQVIAFKEYYFCKINGEIVELTPNDVHKNFHLWTIDDAKNGNVLVASDDSVFIFARVDGYGCIHHIALANDGVLKINPRLISAWESVRGVKPATKEERDLLFTKMKEDGYEWDANKKELIKL